MTKSELNKLNNMSDEQLREWNQAICDIFKERQNNKQKKAAAQFRVGDMVSFFNSRSGEKVVGEVTKINRKSIRVEAGRYECYRVSPSLLSHV
jgi:hypothetical protein